MKVNKALILLLCPLLIHAFTIHTASGGMDLHTAADKGKVSIVQALLDANTNNVNSADQNELTALHYAAGKGHLNIVQLLLGFGADVNATTKVKLTPLHYAAYKGHVSVVQLLLDAGADHRAIDNEGLTALYEAAQAGHAEVVRELVRHGAKLTNKVKNCSLLQENDRALLKECEALIEQHTKEISTPEAGPINDAEIDPQEESTPLRKKIGNHNPAAKEASPSLPKIDDRLHSATRVGDVDTLRRLLEAGAKVNTVQLFYGTPLYCAAGKGHVSVVQLLLKKGADYTATCRLKSTPLHAAAAGGQTETIQLLLDAGADVNATDSEGRTPLHDAANQNQVTSARLLLKAGADHKATDKDGLTPLHLAAERITGAELVQELIARGAELTTQIKGYRYLQRDNQTLLNTCKRLIKQRAESIHELLKELTDDGIDIISFLKKHCDTRLHSAVLTGNISEIKRLLQSGANVNAMELDRWTPLHVAASTGHTEAAELLIQNGAQLEAMDSNGYTALHMTAIRGRAKTMKSLLNAGANPNANDKVGRTPLFMALIGDQEIVLPALLKAGADPRAAMRGGSTPLSVAERKSFLVHRLVASYTSQPPRLVLQSRSRSLAQNNTTIDRPESVLQNSPSPAGQNKSTWQRLFSCFKRTHYDN